MIDEERIERDFRPFSDPATELSVLVGDRLLRVEMIRDGIPVYISIETASSSIKVRREVDGQSADRSFSSLRSLLASDIFASVKSMAENQRRILSEFNAKSFIRPEGHLNDGPLSQEAFEEAAELNIGVTPDAPVSLMLIDGPAGVGKTSLISRLVAKRAAAYGRDGIQPPILHVANRGRRLVSLDELIALSVQLVRAKFTYDQVPALIRNGVIQIAVDGFDELVDSEGYADAWAVLREFIGEIGSGGPLILAGRDTFFDLTGFRDKLGDLSHKVSLSHASLSSITPKAAREWLQSQGWSAEDLSSPDANDLLKENSYALRPYFLSELAKVDDGLTILDEVTNPREYLVRRFINREAALITQRVPLAHETAADLLWELFELVAMEMADAETEAVDVPFLQLAVEVTFGKALTEPTDLAKLRHKAGSFALMDHDARQDYRRFPHTEISNHFLSSALLKHLQAGEAPRFLRRGYFGTDLLTVIGEQLQDAATGDVLQIRRKLYRLTQSDIGFERLSENACSILIGSLVVDSIEEPLLLSGIDAGDLALFGTLGLARLENMSCARLDCRSADLTSVEFINCRAAILVVDANTVLGTDVPQPSCLMVEGSGGMSVEYDPVSINEWIARHRPRESAEDANKQAMELLERVCRVFLRQFHIKEDPTDHAGRYLQDSNWPAVETILAARERIHRTDRKDASGRPGIFLHIVNAHALLSRAEREDREIWDEVAKIDG